MDDARQKVMTEMADLAKQEMDLENELDSVEYLFKNRRNHILNQLARIRLRQGEILRMYGIVK